MSAHFSIPLTILVILTASVLALHGKTQKVDLNTATIAELESLPGIGPSTALRIINAREKRQGFRSLEDLLKIDGIGRKTVARLQPLVRIGKYPIPGTGIRSQQKLSHKHQGEKQ